jgi:hypothetical protein
MARKAPKSIDDLIRARMRRQQVANSLLIFALACAVIAAAGYYIFQFVEWPRPAPPRQRPHAENARVPVAPRATIETPAAPATVPAPLGVEPEIASTQVKKPEAKREASTVPLRPPAQPKRTAPMPLPPPAPVISPEPSRPSANALDQPSAAAAKRMLFSIKCFDDLAFEGSARGRHYFSGLCKDGHRKEVSCAGAGCKVEYARPPSHLQ